eukprot:XP_019922216.1 PREDICTED: transmembrane protein 117 [Crassostrea gigas]
MSEPEEQQKDKPPAKSKRIKVLTMEEDITDKGSVNSEDHLLQKANVSKDHLLQEAGTENREETKETEENNREVMEDSNVKLDKEINNEQNLDDKNSGSSSNNERKPKNLDEDITVIDKEESAPMEDPSNANQSNTNQNAKAQNGKLLEMKNKVLSAFALKNDKLKQDEVGDHCSDKDLEVRFNLDKKEHNKNNSKELQKKIRDVEEGIFSVTKEDLERKKKKKEEEDEVDSMSVWSYFMPKKNFQYHFQHPYLRLFIAYFVTFCNFLIYAEDPVAHSMKECTIPLVGNDFAFVATRYAPNAWSVLKVFLWLSAILLGIVLGKIVVHGLFFNRLCKLRMFEDDMGSFMVMFLASLIVLFVFSWIYNAFLLIGGSDTEDYRISDLMGISNSLFMKMAATGTWCGDFFTAWMVIYDILLYFQDWDFPHFVSAIDIKLPGINTAHIKFDIPKCLKREVWQVHITGKWFNYGILFLVMILDLNMWKNQIFYAPFDYGQYTDSDGKIHSVTDEYSLKTFNESQLSYSYRSVTINPLTNATYLAGDTVMNARYNGYHLVIKLTAFIPCFAAFITFGVLLWKFGRRVPHEKDVYAGRLKKRARDPSKVKFNKFRGLAAMVRAFRLKPKVDANELHLVSYGKRGENNAETIRDPVSS